MKVLLYSPRFWGIISRLLTNTNVSPHRSGHLPTLRPAGALRGRLDGRANKRTEELHRRPDRGCRHQGEATAAETGGLPFAVPARFSDCGGRGEGYLFQSRRWA